MARVATCERCGAPYRVVRGQTRFSCEWCGADNLGAGDGSVEELVVLGDVDEERARRRAEVVLDRRGVRGARLRAKGMRWIELWQVVNEEGEEYVHVVDARAGRLESALRLPAASLGPLEEARTRTRGELPPVPERADVAAIVDGARATFSRPDASLSCVRRILWPVVDLEVWVARARRKALFLGGTEEFVVEPLPARATDPVGRPGLLSAFLVYVALAFAVGVLVAPAATRAAALLGLWVLALAAWSIAERLGTPRP